MKIGTVLLIGMVAAATAGYFATQAVKMGINEMVRQEAVHLAQKQCLGEEVSPIHSNWYRMNDSLFMDTFAAVNCEKVRKWYNDKMKGASGEPTLGANKL